VSFATITLSVASQQVILKVSIYFIINSVQKLLDTSIRVLGFDSQQRLGISPFTTASRTASYPMGTRGSFPGGKAART
jgi:hypothetical protein